MNGALVKLFLLFCVTGICAEGVERDVKRKQEFDARVQQTLGLMDDVKLFTHWSFAQTVIVQKNDGKMTKRRAYTVGDMMSFDKAAALFLKFKSRDVYVYPKGKGPNVFGVDMGWGVSCINDDQEKVYCLIRIYASPRCVTIKFSDGEFFCVSGIPEDAWKELLRYIKNDNSKLLRESKEQLVLCKH